MPFQRRLNPTIDPSDVEWEKVHAMFDFLVRRSDRTLGDILLDHFSTHEIRQFFTQGRPDIKALQQRNTERYHSLLAERFSSVTSDVPTKLSMMFFGLPVEPVREVLEGTESDALAVMEAQVARMKPLAFLENDELSQVTFAPSAPASCDEEGTIDAMDLEQSSQSQSRYTPVTSKAVLTVREQVNLLQAFKSMRDIALSRSFPCPFDGCKYLFNPGNPEDAKTHIARQHVSKKCIWCDETHFEWWNEAQRQRHLREKHRDKLLVTIGASDLKMHANSSAETVVISLTQRGDGADEVTPDIGENAPARHPVGFFCNSCGRDNRNFICSYEKEYHERICGDPALDSNYHNFCVDCGDCNPDNQRGRPRACGHEPNRAIGQFCILCGIDTSLLGEFADLHRSSCRGTGSSARPYDPFHGAHLLSNDDTSNQQATISADQAQRNAPRKIQLVTKSPEQTPLSETIPSLFVPSPASSEDYRPGEDSSDAESERGRSRTRQNRAVTTLKNRKANKDPRRRQDSPDWNVVLGEAEPSFVPDNSYYCSKCLRRVPKANRRLSGRSATEIGEEYKHHIAGDRCCRIRNGIGSAENLPNRSGWIPAKKISKLGMLKSRFLGLHPDYKATVYPLLPSDTKNNMWRSDPNNESNSGNWNLPWPPYIGHFPPVSEEMENADESISPSVGSNFEPDELGDAKGKGGRKRRRNSDGGYTYDSDTDSEDWLSGDDDGLNPNRKRRRRMADGTYRSRRGDESDSDNEPERLKKVREEIVQEIESMREQVDDSRDGATPTKETPNSFIANDNDVQGS
ncbi:hypothetical protein NLG97_g5505 [Lecanicillium saksenae]|uniref:Uncharacterized protein n=1 Tax=Lecanicillium saksenae TaxID=468837 RepID=A0ACC1QVG3_9HYPO|nr:hypothetical protein NLG97_g5505 [Lecanicillium saksenae]